MPQYLTQGNGTRAITSLADLIAHRNARAKRMRWLMDNPAARGRNELTDLRNEINDINLAIEDDFKGPATPAEAWILME